MNHLKLFEDYNIINPFKKSVVKDIVYHTTNSDIFNEFDLDMIGDSSNTTYLDGIFFSDIQTKHFGTNIIKAFINIENPIIIDMERSRFDSGSIQEAVYEAINIGGGSYLVEDLLDYGHVDSEDEAWEIVENWKDKSDGLILKNVQYADHNTEYVIFKNPNNYKQSDNLNEQIKII